MKIQVFKELQKSTNFATYVEYEISEAEATRIIENDYRSRLNNSDDKTDVVRRSVQEIFDEMNKASYNEERRSRKHYADPICFSADSEEVDILDSVPNMYSDYNPELSLEDVANIDILRSVKDEYSDILIEVGYKGMEISEYAALKGISESAARQRLCRARKAMQKEYEKLF